jgi:hypothetical protein
VSARTRSGSGSRPGPVISGPPSTVPPWRSARLGDRRALVRRATVRAARRKSRRSPQRGRRLRRPRGGGRRSYRAILRCLVGSCDGIRRSGRVPANRVVTRRPRPRTTSSRQINPMPRPHQRMQKRRMNSHDRVSGTHRLSRWRAARWTPGDAVPYRATSVAPVHRSNPCGAGAARPRVVRSAQSAGAPSSAEG